MLVTTDRVEAVDASVGELGGGHQRAVAVVAPAVVGAADGGAQGAVVVEELRAPVAAGVEEGSELAVGVAGDDDRAAADGADDGAARGVQLVVEADGDPRGGEDPLLLLGEEGLVDVAVGGQRVGLVDGTTGPDPGVLGGPAGLRDGVQYVGGGGHGGKAPTAREGAHGAAGQR